MLPIKRLLLNGYVVAVWATLAPLIFLLSLQPVFQEAPPIFLFLVGVIFATWYGGYRAGLLATVLSGLAGDYFLIAPFHSLHLAETRDQLRLALFVSMGGALSLVVAQMRHMEQWALREAICQKERLEREIATRQQAEEKLRESEERFRKVFEHAGIGITIADWEGRFQQCNPAFCKLVGYTPEELERMDSAALIHPDDRAANLAEVRRLRDEAMPYFEIESRYLRKDGEPVWVRKFVSLLRDGAGVPTHLVRLVSNITEQRRMNEALREADRQKDEFLAMLAHELRNPLAPVVNAVHILRRPGLNATQLALCRDIIDRQTGHLARLVDDLLDISRITCGKIELRKEPLDVVDLAHRAIETSRSLIEARRHQLTVYLPPEPVRVEGDMVRLSQVVSNLLNNAAKYTDQGGRIWLDVECAGAEVAIRVRDSGRGLDPMALPHVFDLFYQTDRTLDRSEGGLGIGLSLVKRLVDLHGGTVQAFSAGPGRGSEFVIRLPRLPDPPSVDVGAAATAL